MDSLTHIVLGACIGEAIAGKKLGKKAMAWGAFANSIPDFDFIASFWLTMDKNLLVHRGFTHSILFAVLLTPLLAWLGYRWHRSKGIDYLHWIVFLGIEIFCHLFIDTFNNYGIGWLEPFSDSRFSFNTVYVADPLYTIVPLIATIVLIFKRTNSTRQKFWWKLGILAPAVYLLICSFNKVSVMFAAERIMQKEHVEHKRFFVTPTPFNSLLWYVVADADSGLYSGYRSVFDSKDTIHFTYFPKNDKYLSEASSGEDTTTINNLKKFSQGFYTIQKWQDTLVFNDLRFGQIVGWHDPNEKFAFHYFIRHRDNGMAVQRGRFAGWNKETIRSLLRRIKGN